MCVSKYENYTPFNTSRYIIFQEAFNLQLVRLPQPTPSPSLVYPTKKCSSHQNKGTLQKNATNISSVSLLPPQSLPSITSINGDFFNDLIKMTQLRVLP